MVEYKDRLQQAMDEVGISAAMLADRLDTTYQAVKKVLDGKSGAFNAINHAKAAKFLGVNSDWLALGDGPKRAVDGWPFRLINEEKVRALNEKQLAMLEVAIAMDAEKFGLDIAADIADQAGDAGQRGSHAASR